MQLPSGRMLAHYRIIEKIGQGGMGVVYKALDTRLDRHVAIKLLPPEQTLDPERMDHFAREARTAASLNHPNICTIHEVGEVSSTGGPASPFIVMELVDGETLHARLERSGALSVDDILDLTLQLADGLREAHSLGIVHRDLKPMNVIIDPRGRPKILDFGLAGPARAASTDHGNPSEARTASLAERIPQRGGTVAYMSPEQALGRDLDTRSDVFSLGTMLYEMATGKNPFLAETSTGTLAKILEAEPVPVGSLNAELPDDFARVVTRCLRKSPADRFEDASAIVSELRAIRERSSDDGPKEREVTISPTTVAVMPFAVRGSKSYAYLSEGMVDLLATKLDGAGDLRSVDAHVVLCCRSVESAGVSDPQGAMEAAHRLGAGLFILGNVLEAGGQLHIDAALYDSSEGPKVAAKGEVRGTPEEIFAMVDRLTAQLLAGRCGGPRSRFTRIAAMATPSFPALKAYLEGEREMRHLRRTEAIEAFERAVQEDPSFSLAWYRLSVAALWSHQPEKAWDAVRTAVQHSHRLSERDRRLLAAFHAVVRGSTDEAERLYRNIVGAYPDDIEAWYQLGEILFHYGPKRGRPLQESRPAWERLLSLDPGHLPALVHLGIIAASRGDREGLEPLARQTLKLSPESDAALWMRVVQGYGFGGGEATERATADLRKAGDYTMSMAIGFVGAYLRNLPGAEALTKLLTDSVRSVEARSLGHILRAHLELARGRWTSSKIELERAAPLHPAYALEYRALLSLFPFNRTTDREMDIVRADLEAWKPEPHPAAARPSLWLAPHEGAHGFLREYLLGLLEARQGKKEARERAEWLHRMAEEEEESSALIKDLSLSLRAQIAASSGEVAEALRLLERMRMQTNFYMALWSPFYSQARERFALAERLHRAGRDLEALRWYGSFEESSIFEMIYVPPAHLRRGEIHEKLGHRERAAEHYKRFLEYWREPEPELRALADEARGGLERLG